jgi:hypothetical protein
MVIQKPAPAEPPAVAEVKPQRVREPARKTPPPPTQRVVHKPAPQPAVVSTPPASADAPPLEPASISQQQASLQQRVSALQQAIQARIERLNASNLPGADRKTLEDARTFVTQSQDAMKRGDWAQASNLAQKAALLVQAVEKRH